MNKKDTEKSPELEKLDLRSHEIAADKAAELLRLFPEIRTEGGKIDFDRLKRVLGETADPGKERYGMNWPGKADCFKTIQQPSLATLRPCPEESVNFDTTENLIIEGDNLEVLKLLQKSYIGKIKMIYIDPPYNTGNDFIYPDNYSESLQTYLEYTKQVDDQGKKFSTNTDTDGRFHSKWLNMMYPRLYLARNLLKENGVLFISIGQTEISNLVDLCDDIFGEENRIAICTRLMKTGGQKGKFFSPNTDYVVIYARNIEMVEPFRDDLGEELIAKVYNQIETDGPRKGEHYRIMGLFQPTLDARANQRYFIQCPDGSFVIPPGTTFPIDINQGSKIKPLSGDGVWRWTYDRYHNEFSSGNIVFKETTTSPLLTAQREKSKWNIYTKIWLKERQEEGRVPLDVFEKFENRHSSQELEQLNIPFDFAKPKDLISYLMGICNVGNNEIVLDFFAGSGTTAHAAFALNKEDNENRHFILVQLPEPTRTQNSDGSWNESPAWKAGHKTISDITKERVRQVIARTRNESKQQPLLEADESEKLVDLGFKVFKLTESNFKPWQAEVPSGDTETLTKQLEFHASNLRDERTPADFLYEILLKSGFPLATKVEKLSLSGKAVFSIAEGAMLICLDDALTHELIKAMADRKPERVICLDEGFAGNDQLKTNAVQTMKARGVTSFKTV